jgi:hypothetical protein
MAPAWEQGIHHQAAETPGEEFYADIYGSCKGRFSFEKLQYSDALEVTAGTGKVMWGWLESNFYPFATSFFERGPDFRL